MNRTGPNKNTFENIKYFKIQHLFNNPKVPMPSTPKIQIFEIQNLRNISLIPVYKYAKSTPWACIRSMYNFCLGQFLFFVLVISEVLI